MDCFFYEKSLNPPQIKLHQTKTPLNMKRKARKASLRHRNNNKKRSSKVINNNLHNKESRTTIVAQDEPKQEIKREALEAAGDDFRAFSIRVSSDSLDGFSTVTCDKSSVIDSIEFMDEEALFNMPALLDSMAEGMLLTPLGMKKGFNWSGSCEIDEDHVELSCLWSE